MCIHTVSTQYKSPFCILKCVLSTQTCKNLQIWSTLFDHLYLQKSPVRTLIGPNGGQNSLKLKNKPQKWKSLVVGSIGCGQAIAPGCGYHLLNCCCGCVAFSTYVDTKLTHKEGEVEVLALMLLCALSSTSLESTKL